MTEQRKRHDIYYLERMKGPALLHEDGTVGKIGERNVEVTSHLPSRVEGRERVVTKVESRMGEVAVYASMGEYLSYEKHRPKSDRYQEGHGWALEDMPNDVLLAYETWSNSVSVDIDGIRALALLKVATDEDRYSATMRCKDCTEDSSYACRMSGDSKELYTYPIVRYEDENTTYDVPFDVAGVISRKLDAVTTEIRPEFDNAGKMSAKRLLIIKAQAIPKAYVDGRDGDEMIFTAPGEHMEDDIEIVIDYWNEDPRLAERDQQSWAHANKFSAQMHSEDNAEKYLEYMQFYVAQMLYVERKDPKDYDAMLQKLHAKVGSRGLGLAYEYAYAGMGESDARIMLTKEMQGYLITSPITYTYEARHALERAAEYLEKR